MWMKETRATQILVTVWHKHKYITNLDITPKDQVIAESGKLVEELKCRMPTHLSETTLEQSERIRTILKKGRAQTVHNNPPIKPTNPPPPPHPKLSAYAPF